MLTLGNRLLTNMKYLNLIIILIISSVILSGCAFQYQVDDLQARVIYLESQLSTFALKSKLANLEKLSNELVQEVANLKELEEVKDLSEIKSQLEAFQIVLKLHEDDLTELKDFKERATNGLVMIAEEIDKHVEAIESLASNDDSTKRILESSLALFIRIDERQKIFEDWLREIRHELDLED